MKLNAFSRGKPGTKPQFGRKRVKQKANEREYSVGESLLRSCVPSEVKPTMHQEEKEEAEERRERLAGRKEEQAAKQYALSRRKSATKPSFSR
jgi:hypothetical protein